MTGKNTNVNKSVQMTTDEALGLIISASLSVHQYKLLRKQTAKLNHDIYPAYNKVLAAKNDTYPDKISITEDICEVNKMRLCNNLFLHFITILYSSRRKFCCCYYLI